MNKIMAHMIPFYPDRNTSVEVAKGILEGGARYLEVQFPYSDPTADGPVIEAACTKALKAGFTVTEGFRFVKEMYDWTSGYPKGIPVETAQSERPDIFIMSYASLVFARGVERFVNDTVKSGAKGLIVPDLPPDSDEGLYEACRRAGIHCVPVLVPFMTSERLELVLAAKPAYVYFALRAGTTGIDTVLDQGTLDLLSSVSKRGPKVLGGFGISKSAQVQQLAPAVHACVVGSALVRLVDLDPGLSAQGPSSIRKILADFMAKLVSAQ